MVQDRHPDGRTEDHQAHGADQAQPAANHGTTGGEVFPVHGKQQHREVTAGSDRERQAHHERDVLAFEQDTQADCQYTQSYGGDLRHANLIFLVRLAFLDHAGVKVMGHRRSTGQGQASNHRKDGSERHSRDEAQEDTATHRVGQVHRRHVVATEQGACRIFERRVGADQQDRAEADDKGQDVEVADETGGVEHALASFFSVTHGEEAHQDMRQASGTEHQRQAQRECRDRVLHQAAGAHDRLTFRVNLDRLGEQHVEVEVDVFHHHQRHERGTGQQQHRLDDLYPGGRQHAAEQHIQHHQDAYQDHRNVVVQAEQQLDQLAGTDHLRDQVKRHHHQRAACRQAADLGLAQAIGRHVGKGVLAQVTQALGDQEQNDRPAHQEADRVDQPVITGGVHQCGNPQEGRRRHVVTGNRQAVLETGDLAAGRIVVGRRFIALGRPVSDAQGGADKRDKHHDGRHVQGLFVHFTGQGIRSPKGRSKERCAEYCQ